MKKIKACVSAILICAIVFAFCPSAFAAELEPSEEIIRFIEEYEGYKKYAYADAGGWSIGYGTNCGRYQFPNGVSKAEAHELMRKSLRRFTSEINAFTAENGIKLTQNEFDALVSFTYNLGEGWMINDSKLATYLKNRNYTEDQFVKAIGVYGHMGKTVLSGLVERRIAEAKIFLYGDYEGANSPDFCYLKLDRRCGELNNDIYCFRKGSPYGSLPQPEASGKYFAGWKTVGGKVLTESDIVSESLSVTATWSSEPVPAVVEESSAVTVSAVQSGTFSDVPQGDTSAYAIDFCAKNGLMNGIGNDKFDPEGTMSRAMLATVIWRLAGSPGTDGATTYTDVAKGKYYTNAVRWASCTGIMKGYSDRVFGVGDNVTREQLAVVISRFAAIMDVDVSASYMAEAIFSDSVDIASYAKDAAAWTAENGMLETFEGCFLPKQNAARAQAALAVAVLYQMI